MARPEGLTAARRTRLASAEVSTSYWILAVSESSAPGKMNIPVRASNVIVSVGPAVFRTRTFSSAGIVTVRSSVVVVGCVLHRAPGAAVQLQVSVLVRDGVIEAIEGG